MSHPCGVRGLKLALPVYLLILRVVAPIRGRGLKYPPFGVRMIPCESHPARGAWIEVNPTAIFSVGKCRTPQGVRGLKLCTSLTLKKWILSHTAGVRGLKRNALGVIFIAAVAPRRGAWIEVLPYNQVNAAARVAPHAGCVD